MLSMKILYLCCWFCCCFCCRCCSCCLFTSSSNVIVGVVAVVLAASGGVTGVVEQQQRVANPSTSKSQRWLKTLVSQSSSGMRNMPAKDSKYFYHSPNTRSQWESTLGVSKYIGAAVKKHGAWEPDLLPESIDVYVDTDLLGGGDHFLASQMMSSGRVQGTLSNGIFSNGAIVASYLIIADMYGNLLQASPSSDFTGIEAFEQELRDAGPTAQYHGDAVTRIESSKVLGPKEGLFAQYAETSLSGYCATLNKYEVVRDGKSGSGKVHVTTFHHRNGASVMVNPHDAQWLPQTQTMLTATCNDDPTTYKEPAIHPVTGEIMTMLQYEALVEYNMDGDEVWRWRSEEHLIFDYYTIQEVNGDLWTPDAMWIHFNHYHAYGDGAVYVSSRNLFSIFKIDKESSEIKWICGGPYGTLDIIMKDGTVLPKGSSVFHSQHNAEYIGDNTVVVFDNAVIHNHQSTRMKETADVMKLRIDEEAGTATVIWTWATGALTNIFGDADPLPGSKSMMVTMWQAGEINRCSDDGSQYEASVVEVTEEGDVAWSINFKPTWRPWLTADPCTSYINAPGIAAPQGWAMYTAERYYTAPLMHQMAIHFRTDNGRLSMYDVLANQNNGGGSAAGNTVGDVCYFTATAYDSTRTHFASIGTIALRSPAVSEALDDSTESTTVAQADIKLNTSFRASAVFLPLPLSVCLAIRPDPNTGGFILPDYTFALTDALGNTRVLSATGSILEGYFATEDNNTSIKHGGVISSTSADVEIRKELEVKKEAEVEEVEVASKADMQKIDIVKGHGADVEVEDHTLDAKKEHLLQLVAKMLNDDIQQQQQQQAKKTGEAAKSDMMVTSPQRVQVQFQQMDQKQQGKDVSSGGGGGDGNNNDKSAPNGNGGGGIGAGSSGGGGEAASKMATATGKATKTKEQVGGASTKEGRTNIQGNSGGGGGSTRTSSNLSKLASIHPNDKSSNMEGFTGVVVTGMLLMMVGMILLVFTRSRAGGGYGSLNGIVMMDVIGRGRGGGGGARVSKKGAHGSSGSRSPTVLAQWGSGYESIGEQSVGTGTGFIDSPYGPFK